MSDHCAEHSGACEAIESLKKFQEGQTGKGGTNERLFGKLDDLKDDLAKNTACVQGLYGGVKTGAWIIGIGLSILGTLLLLSMNHFRDSIKLEIRDQYDLRSQTQTYRYDNKSSKTEFPNLIPNESNYKEKAK